MVTDMRTDGITIITQRNVIDLNTDINIMVAVVITIISTVIKNVHIDANLVIIMTETVMYLKQFFKYIGFKSYYYYYYIHWKY